MHEINEKRERLGEYHRICVELQSHEDFRSSSINFSVNSSAWQICLRNTNVRCPPRFRLVHRVSPPPLTVTVQSHIIQFERLPQIAARLGSPRSMWPKP